MTTGIMRKNECNRYEISDSIEFTSGDIIEFQFNNGWVKSSVECANGEYFIVGYEDITLDGLIVRK